MGWVVIVHVAGGVEDRGVPHELPGDVAKDYPNLTRRSCKTCDENKYYNPRIMENFLEKGIEKLSKCKSVQMENILTLTGIAKHIREIIL